MDTASDRRLGRAALVIASLLIATVAITAAIGSAHARPRGEVEIPAEWRSQSDYTMIIFGRESCPACAASVAFHKELAKSAAARGVRVIAASTSGVEKPEQFATSIGVPVDHAIRANPAPKNLKSVPAIVIVNRAGTILRKTEGALTPEQRRSLTAYLATLH